MISENRHSISKGTIGFRAALTVGLIGLLPMAAVAAQGSRTQFEGPAVVVNYTDLDINTSRGAEKLYERIEHAAAQLCPQVDIAELQRYAVFLRCRDEVVAHAVSSINSPQLAAVYASRTHHVAHSPV
jgi:UrcA family protein